jgi:hypothetical protein
LLAVDTKELEIKRIRFAPVFKLRKNLDVATRARAFDLVYYIYFRSECGGKNDLKGLDRENAQLILNKIWELPIETAVETIVAKLPTTFNP